MLRDKRRIQKNRILSALLSAAFLLAGTGLAGTETEAAETSEVTHIRVLVWDRWSDGENNSSDCVLTQWLQKRAEEELGIEVEFVLPQGSTEEMLADGNVPDIFFVGQEEFLRYAKQGLLADLTEAYEKLGASAGGDLSGDGESVNRIQALGEIEKLGEVDGRRYALVSRREDLPVECLGYIRKDWLEALDMEVPTTKEELIAYLYALKEQNPGGEGELIPWAMSGSSYNGDEYLGFVGSYVSLESERDAYLYSGEYMAVAPGALEGIRQLNTLYQDGILSPNLITDSSGSRCGFTIIQGKAGFFCNQMSGAWSTIRQLMDEGSFEENPYLPASCFELPEGGYRIVFAPEYGDGDFGFVCVPAASQEKAEACVRYLNWMADEEVAEDILYGPEHKRNEYGAPLWFSGEECSELGYPWPVINQTYSLMTRHLSYQDDPEAMLSYWKLYYDASAFDEDWLRQQWDMTQAGKFCFPELAVIPEAETKYGKDVESGIRQYVYQLICCEPGEFESLQETLYEELEEKGLAQILEERAECYDSYGAE